MTRPTEPPEAPNENFPRLSQEPFPSYRFIPGINPHPMRDPDGHSYGQIETKHPYISPDKWQTIDDYLMGIDLYNYAYWWESHEKWEGIWHSTNKDSDYGQFLQGLIQISAAFIKWHLHQHDGLTRLYQIGFSRLESVQKNHNLFMGVNLSNHLTKLMKHFDTILIKSEKWPNPLKNYPFIEVTPMAS